MLKSTHSLLFMVIAALPLSVSAQYIQMVVDDQNRVLPIIFTHSAPVAMPPVIATQQRYSNAASIVQRNPPRPVQIPQRQTVSTPKFRSSPRDPMRGPYYISPSRHRLMNAAHSALGIPYIYGGNNPARGLDCSSLMQFIHKRVGVKLPRTAAAQRDKSKTIPLHSLQPGDLLFYKINARTNHVGVYIGHGKFIHASSSNRRAVVASMQTRYWKKRFVKAGSYIGS